LEGGKGILWTGEAVIPDSDERLFALINAAYDLDPSQRQAFLDRECADQPALKNKLLRMLEFADQSGGFLSNPPWKLNEVPEKLAAAQVFQPDQIVSERYRIVRFIDLGGMGEVYEAHDQELDCRVALKTIRQELAADELSLARFKREIQLAREVSHENVCKMHDFGRHESSPGVFVNYLTMQFLTGETLSQKLKRDGKLSPAQALPLALQIAAALDAAHRARILHRDLKSANVMLVPGSRENAGESPEENLRAVVTDFGLARRMKPSGAPPAENTLTKPGDAMGTLDYMAPELLAGAPATAESDIYAFGVILYEMVCGQRPFSKESAHVAAFKRAQGLPPVAELLPGVSRRWQRAVSRCLEPNPSRRSGLLEIVGILTGSATAASLSRPWPLGISKRYASLKDVFLAVSILGLVLSAILMRHYLQAARIHPGSSVYVMELTNATQDPELDAAGDLLRNQLRQSAYFRMVDDAKVVRARALISSSDKRRSATEVGREVALRTGAALAVFSSLSAAGDSYNLLVQIDRVGPDPLAVRRTWRRDFPASGKLHVFEAVREAADYVREVAGESSNDIAARDLTPQEAASNSWEALRLYGHAEELRKKSQTETALADLRRAIEIDPDFALAHMRLGDILFALRRQEEGLEHFRVAINAANKRRLTRWEELRLRGLYNLDIGEYSQAEGALSEWRELYPNDFLPSTYLADALAGEGRLEQVVEMRREATRKDPGAYQPLVGLATAYALLGRMDDAEQVARELQEVGGDAISLEWQGLVKAMRGDMNGAILLFERVAAGSDRLRKSAAVSLLGQAHAEIGQYERAIGIYQDGIAADLAAGLLEQAGQKHLAVAALYFREGQRVLSRSHSLEAVRLVRRLEVYRRAGAILARQGDTEDTRKILADIRPTWPGPLAEAARRHLRGELLLQQGEGAAALTELEACDRLDSPVRNREYLAYGFARSGDLQRALFCYDSMTKLRAMFWYCADCELPAMRPAILLEIGKLAQKLGQPDRAESAIREYGSIRPNADASLHETKTVQQILAGLPDGKNQLRRSGK
jgi:eukaryotic-like serine/threonine-protein kinase